MSNVVKGRRAPGQLRAVLNLTVGGVLLCGCSAGSDRFTSAGFDSGYNTPPRASEAAAPSTKIAANTQAPAQQRPAYPLAQPAAYQAQPAGGYQLTSANAGQTGSYMQASRVDLPPLSQRQPSQGRKLADGYGPYNQPPLPDGSYTGPRVRMPYDEPRSDLPPMGVYTPEGSDPSRYGRGAPPPPSNYYASPEGAPPPPAYGPRDETRIYEPRPDRGYADARPYNGGERPPYSRDAGPGAPAPHRSWSGRTDGEMVEVVRGDTVYSLARRYGVTVDMIARANGLSSVYVRPGIKLFIPRADPASYAQAPSQPKPQAQARMEHAPADPAAKDQQRLAAVPSGKARQNAPAAGQDLKAVPAPGSARLADRGEQDLLKAPAPAPAPVQPGPAVKIPAPASMSEASCEAALSNPQPRMGINFRKPVEGMTIGPYGLQKDGTVNEGITISVPKGTPVKAAENGVVAYVGNELPGFGNLILIRHADEYVTAYAHADTVTVKKCDPVKRGQTIATAGATGDASQPQVHFEIRKNSKPVDPTPLLGS